MSATKNLTTSETNRAAKTDSLNLTRDREALRLDRSFSFLFLGGREGTGGEGEVMKSI